MILLLKSRYERRHVLESFRLSLRQLCQCGHFGRYLSSEPLFQCHSQQPVLTLAFCTLDLARNAL